MKRYTIGEEKYHGYTIGETIDIKEYTRNANRARNLNPIRLNERGRVVKEKEPNVFRELARFVASGIVLLATFLFLHKLMF